MDCQLVLCVILHLVLFFAPRSEQLISLHRMTHHLLPPLVHNHHLMLHLVLQWQLSIMYQLHLLPTHDQGILRQEIDLELNLIFNFGTSFDHLAVQILNMGRWLLACNGGGNGNPG